MKLEKRLFRQRYKKKIIDNFGISLPAHTSFIHLFNSNFYLGEETLEEENTMLNRYLFNFHKKNKKKAFSVTPKIYQDASEEIFDYYYYFRFSSFIDFFDKRDIDVPKCFVGVRSLRRFSFELLLLKFSNLLMRDGKREKIFKMINETFYLFRKSNPTYLSVNEKNLAKWYEIYFFFASVLNKFNTTNAVWHTNYQHGDYENFYLRRTKICSLDYNLNELLLKTMFVTQPLFYFSVYNIDKNVKKFTRKKNNKFVFVWKYVPLYKRKIVTLRLVTKDIKFNSGHKLKTRFFNSLMTFKHNPQESFVCKINHFTHNYVFKNLRKSLLKDLKSSS